MGFLNKLFGNKKTEAASDKGADFSYIAEIARLISSDNEELCERVVFSLTNPDEYFSENITRFGLRGLDVYSADRDTLYWICLVDELSEHGYLFGVDWKCEAEDFKWALSQLKSGDVIPDIELNENDDVVEWGKIINGRLSDYCVCWIDIDSDSYELIIVTNEAYDEISKTAANNGRRIVKF